MPGHHHYPRDTTLSLIFNGCVVIIFRRIFKYMQEKLFIQCNGVFFYECILANHFYFQINGLGSAVRTNISQALGPGSNLCWAVNFYDFTEICRKFHLFPWHNG